MNSYNHVFLYILNSFFFFNKGHLPLEGARNISYICFLKVMSQGRFPPEGEGKLRRPYLRFYEIDL